MIPDWIEWVANFWFLFYEICVQYQWGHKVLKSKWRPPTLAVCVQLQRGWNTYLLFNSNSKHCVENWWGEAGFIVLLIFVIWQCFNHWWVRGEVWWGGAESLIQGQLKLPPFSGKILAKSISMTLTGMLYWLDISTFNYYDQLLFQIFAPQKFIKT